MLCAIFLFLSDLDDGAFFLLSSLTDAVESFLAEIKPVNWTSFSDRKALVRTLQFLQKVGVLIVHDGDNEEFQRERTQEVLYLIKLLVKIRAPKLSRDKLRPSTVRTILDESLQVLTDDDLSVMVAAMKRMDALKKDLDSFRAAMGDAQTIRQEYERYNQCHLVRPDVSVKRIAVKMRRS